MAGPAETSGAAVAREGAGWTLSEKPGRAEFPDTDAKSRDPEPELATAESAKKITAPASAVWVSDVSYHLAAASSASARRTRSSTTRSLAAPASRRGADTSTLSLEGVGRRAVVYVRDYPDGDAVSVLYMSAGAPSSVVEVAGKESGEMGAMAAVEELGSGPLKEFERRKSNILTHTRRRLPQPPLWPHLD